MKAAIYSRFSTDKQTDSSIFDQVRVCSEYAGKNGLAIVAQFEDQGISGAAFGNRPGVLRMREAALAGRFNVLLINDLSRLSRSQDLAPLLSRLRHRGVRVIGVQDGFDSDSRTARMQAGLSGIMSEEFRAMIADRTHTALESRAKEKRPTGGRAYGYEGNAIKEDEAVIVREIFGRYATGESCRSLAADLNKRGVPSPGSSWSRTIRRASGWMGSGIRAIIRNERYRGAIRWNTSVWVKDPDTGKRTRRERPRSEWVSHQDESLRIVADSLFERAQRRTAGIVGDWSRSGGKPKYLLSGLLRCSKCDAHYVISDATSYACSSHINGGACSNSVRVRRSRLEEVLIGKLQEDLLSPESIKVIAQDMQEYFRAQARASEQQAVERPREVQELEARLDRLRERLRRGDPDLAADELQSAIDRVDEKRRALVEAQPTTNAATARVLAMLPKAAETARREIAEALKGDSRASAKARVMLRGAYSGRIELQPDDAGGLTAHWNLNSLALLRPTGTCGSGGRI